MKRLSALSFFELLLEAVVKNWFYLIAVYFLEYVSLMLFELVLEFLNRLKFFQF